jgi:hypothetical protein
VIFRFEEFASGGSPAQFITDQKTGGDCSGGNETLGRERFVIIILAGKWKRNLIASPLSLDRPSYNLMFLIMCCGLYLILYLAGFKLLAQRSGHGFRRRIEV